MGGTQGNRYRNIYREGIDIGRKKRRESDEFFEIKTKFYKQEKIK